MTEYNRNAAMVEHDKSFRCYNCNKLMVKHIEGHYQLKLTCPRCKTEMSIKCNEAIPVAIYQNTIK